MRRGQSGEVLSSESEALITFPSELSLALEVNHKIPPVFWNLSEDCTCPKIDSVFLFHFCFH